jgi:DNA-binding NtrC family response regulator
MVVERATFLAAGGAIDVDHLDLDPEIPGAPPRTASGAPARARFEPESGETTGGHATLRAQIESIEKQSIIDALAKSAGNQSTAAKMVGLARSTFMKKLELYGIARPRKGRN